MFVCLFEGLKFAIHIIKLDRVEKKHIKYKNILVKIVCSCYISSNRIKITHTKSNDS